MTLLELCEPLWLKIGELNRMARLGQSQDYLDARAELADMLDKIGQQIQSDPALGRAAGPLVNVERRRTAGAPPEAQTVRQIELVLAYFVDSMIGSSRLKFAPDWNGKRLAAERYNELAGDDRFFDFLDETLNDPSDDAAERLAVFYVCLGMGFVGALVGQPDKVQSYVSKLMPRVRHLMDLDAKARLCPDAYTNVDTRNLVEPPSNRLVFVLILFLCFCVSTLVAYVGLYVNATGQLNQAIEKIQTEEARQPVAAKAEVP